MICDRCNNEINAHITSIFNLDQICFDCKKDEELAPGFKEARDAETAAVLAGNYNYRGLGLSVEDHEFLEERRQLRKENQHADAS